MKILVTWYSMKSTLVSYSLYLVTNIYTSSTALVHLLCDTPLCKRCVKKSPVVSATHFFKKYLCLYKDAFCSEFFHGCTSTKQMEHSSLRMNVEAKEIYENISIHHLQQDDNKNGAFVSKHMWQVTQIFGLLSHGVSSMPFQGGCAFK